MLKEPNGNQTLAVRLLGIDKVSLWGKLKRYNPKGWPITQTRQDLDSKCCLSELIADAVVALDQFAVGLSHAFREFGHVGRHSLNSRQLFVGMNVCG